MLEPQAPTTHFDLIAQPWITVRRHDGFVEDVSLLDAFREADGIREMVGEMPTQVFAIIRLMLAILYRTVTPSQLDSERWQGLWESGLPLTDIERYLDRHRDRFDLLDPEYPFFQVANLHTAKGDAKDVAQLIFDLPSNNRLFTTRSGIGLARLSFAEAARWVVNTQAFDASGIKSGAEGDPRVKGGRGYPIGVAWSGLLGGLIVEGNNLRETLLLNLAGGRDSDDADVAPWERGPDGPAEGLARPNGPVSLYTWQSRRIRLISDGHGIVGSLVTNGDQLTPQNGQALGEHMSAWRFSEPQTKRAGLETYMPREHQSGRALWRGIGALLPKTEVTTTGKDAARSLAPGTLDWLSFLQHIDRLDPGHHVRLRAIGAVYGNMNSVVDDVIDDRMIVSLALLHDRNALLARAAETAVGLAEEGVRALRRLAENLARAAGGDGEGPRNRAEEAGYAALDAPYRRWVAGLRTDGEAEVMLRAWKASALGIVRRLGDEFVAGAGPAAWQGRMLQLHGREPEIVNTARAEHWFRLALRNTFEDNTVDNEEDSAR